MTKEELEKLWKELVRLHDSSFLKSSTFDDVFDSMQCYCNENGIDFGTLDIND